MKHNPREEECCPRFDPTPWDRKIHKWDKKRFVKEKGFSLFYMPMNFGVVMKRLDKKVRQAGATIQDALVLSDHTSKWNIDLYAAVDKEVPDAENTTISGSFLSKVYEGDFRNTGNWCRDFESYAQGEHLKVKKQYMWYTTCPKCAKKYGRNYVVIVAELA